MDLLFIVVPIWMLQVLKIICIIIAVLAISKFMFTTPERSWGVQWWLLAMTACAVITWIEYATK